MLRKLVSGNRVRTSDDRFNLDLTYIVPGRIIAMSYPSSGFEKLYRNSIADVSVHLHILKISCRSRSISIIIMVKNTI